MEDEISLGLLKLRLRAHSDVLFEADGELYGF